MNAPIALWFQSRHTWRRVTERFRLADGGKRLIASQEYDDPQVIENRGVRYIAWRRVEGDHVHGYDCDPAFAENYKPEP